MIRKLQRKKILLSFYHEKTELLTGHLVRNTLQTTRYKLNKREDRKIDVKVIYKRQSIEANEILSLRR